jgi:Zn finger protein HypA/HybF involved in hydrogenase expression
MSDFWHVMAKHIGPFTVLQWSIGAIAFGFALQIGTAIKHRLIANKATGMSKAKCLNCSWSGRVSKFHRTCPKCGNVVTRV